LHQPSIDRPGLLQALDPSKPNTPTLGVPELDVYAEQGLITRIHAQLTSGKEATVYCCRAHPSTNRKFLAAKVYRAHAASAYRRSGSYFEGRERAMKARTHRAIQRGTTFGREALRAGWIAAEFEALRRLSARGASVPRPLAQVGSSILMEYVGNGAGPAPHLHGIDLDEAGAQRLLDLLLAEIETMLRDHLIHGDLSPHNILVWKDRPWIIDLPQAIDVRFNRSAFQLLSRDIANVCTFFATCGTRSDPAGIAHDLWTRYRRAEI